MGRLAILNYAVFALVLISPGLATQSSRTGQMYSWMTTTIDYPSTGYRLEGFVIRQKTNVQQLVQCAMHCYRTAGCKSYNYRASTKHCEMNSATDRTQRSNLRQADGYTYMRKEGFQLDRAALGPCIDEPCENGGTCFSRRTTQGDIKYDCLCKKDWTGTHCNEPAGTIDWGDWQDWGECSSTCDQGWQVRIRDCMNQDGDILTGLDCFGRDQEERMCPDLMPCPRWEAWTEWGECSTATTCGAGNRLRTRGCLYNGTPNVDRLCMGNVNETTPCFQPKCSGALKLEAGASLGEGRLIVYDDVTSQWGAVCSSVWDANEADLVCRQLGFPSAAGIEYSAALIADISTLPYTLGGLECSGTERSLQSCYHDPWTTDLDCVSGDVKVSCIVNGDWNTWSAWGECSVTCEQGIRLRSRICDYPPALRGGRECEGEAQQSKVCTEIPCPVDGAWLPWTDWDACNTTCGGGYQQRQRTCDDPEHGGTECIGPDTNWQQCNTHHCPIDCQWLAWSEWASCNTTCGGGYQQRSRDVDGPYYGGADCQGPSFDWQTCNEHNCPIDCVWQEWQGWQACNVSCGGGQQLRVRDADGPYYGGADCVGTSDDWQECNTQECPIDCVWNMWDSWNTCNRSCGGGFQSRERTRDGPYYGGSDCDGPQDDWQACNTHACPVDCMWNEWATWAECNVTCGGGSQFRLRTKEGPHHDGLDCEGPEDDWQLCNIQECPVDGFWAEWSAWGECSASCENGTQERTRECVPPMYGGAECVGPSNDIQDCFLVMCPVDGVWEEWSDWDTCSHLCGTGSQQRTRTCQEPLYGGAECDGLNNETQACNQFPCPENGVWLPWSEWDSCTYTCGGGESSRSRMCIPPRHGGESCDGDYNQTRDCNMQECPVDCVWANWSEWGECNRTCGGGYQQRQRTSSGPFYGGAECEGEASDWQVCNVESCAVHCVWLEWADWSPCNQSCGFGTQSRTRGRDGPLYGGDPCVGSGEHLRLCNEFHCPTDCVWNEWGVWGHCNQSCGVGFQKRSRTSQGPQHGGMECIGDADEWSTCNEHECPVDCVWHSWEAWQDCDITCGGGMQNRTRHSEGPMHDGVPCEGPTDESQECNTHECPIDCIWKEWQAWQSCNVTCGGGTQLRLRETQGPFYGGAECAGSHSDIQDCNTHECPVDCEWLSWSEWAECNTTCGGGYQQRSRGVDGPYYGGADCLGATSDWQECNMHNCPVDCVWDEWSSWGGCNVSCGGGTQMRYREPDGPYYGGQECTGSELDDRSCNDFECPIDCVWREWESWETCSVSCGGGLQKRSRPHSGPFYGGQPCQGSADAYEDCNMQNCPIDGFWLDWSSWSECSLTCGGGEVVRNRTCQEPLYGGLECQGSDTDVEPCNTQPCPIPGDWMTWGEWGECSNTCNGGTRVRNRECDWDSYGDLTAQCLGTNSTSEPCNEFDCLPIASTCSEYLERGLINSDWVQVDPDGDTGWLPFYAYCETKGPQRGVIILHHQYENDTSVEGYEGAGEYTAKLTYQDHLGNMISTDQIMGLVDASETCRQFISWKCTSAIFNPDEQTLIAEDRSPYKLTYWANRWEEAMNYWGGAEPDMNPPSMTCACGMDGTCAGEQNLCNCDSNDAGNWRKDDGWLTTKYDLPVTSFHAGDTGDRDETGIFHVGPLICNGTSSGYDNFW